VIQQVGPIALGLAILPFNILNTFFLLASIVFIFVRFSKDRNTNQALVAISFTFLACAHLSNVLGYLAPMLLEVENILRLAGYLSLLVMLVRLKKKT